MKRLIFIVTACLLIASLSVPDWAPMAPGSELYICDEAGTLSNSTKKEISVSAAALMKQTEVRIMVITVDHATIPEAIELRSSSEDSNTISILLETQQGLIWVKSNSDLAEMLKNADGDSYLGLHEVTHFDAGVRNMYRTLLSCVMKKYGIATLPRFGIWEKWFMLSRTELVVVATALLIFVVFAGWMKRRFYPPRYPLEEAGPHRPVEVPDLTTFKPR